MRQGASPRIKLVHTRRGLIADHVHLDFISLLNVSSQYASVHSSASASLDYLSATRAFDLIERDLAGAHID